MAKLTKKLWKSLYYKIRSTRVKNQHIIDFKKKYGASFPSYGATLSSAIKIHFFKNLYEISFIKNYVFDKTKKNTV